MSTQTCFITAGKTSQTFDVSLVQKAAAASPGDPLTGLTYNAAGLTAYYRKGATGTPTAIALATLANAGASFSAGGLVELDATHCPGLYRFDAPDTVIASAGIASVTLTGAPNLATHTIFFVVTAVDLYDSVRGGMTALPNAAAGAAGSVNDVTRWLGTAPVTPNTAGVPVMDVARWLGTVPVTPNLAGLPLIDLGRVLGTAPPTPAAAGLLPVDLTTWLGVQPKPLTAQRVETLVGAMANAVMTAAAHATDSIDANALKSDAVAEIVAGMRAMSIDTQGAWTIQQVLSLMFAAACGVTSSGGTVFKTPDGVATRLTVGVDGSNNRTSQVTNPST
jgi:hypothetical protein